MRYSILIIALLSGCTLLQPDRDGNGELIPVVMCETFAHHSSFGLSVCDEERQ